MPEGAASRRVAVVGLGRMGRPMSRHISAAGFSVTGCDVAPEARGWAQDIGLAVAGSPTEAAADADVVMVLTGNEQQVQDVTIGQDGIFAAGGAGVVMIASTVSPELVQALAREAVDTGYTVVDSPCARGERGAMDANLLWFVGGEARDVDYCRPVMEACGPDVHHLGPVGAGQVAKALNNMLLWAALCADHEALDLAQLYDVDPVALRAALTRSSASNWALEHWDDMTNIPWAIKDMEILLRMADRVGADAPLAGLVRERVARHVRAAGWS